MVAADLYTLKGSLRIFQRRFKEALELFDRSLAIFERTGDRRRQIEQLLNRAAVASYAGWSETAIADLTVALGIAKELKAEDLSVTVAISLGAVLVNSGQFERGAAAVNGVDRPACQRVGPLMPHLVEWVEGAAEHGLGDHASAEENYLAARAGFEDLGQTFYCAFAALLRKGEPGPKGPGSKTIGCGSFGTVPISSAGNEIGGVPGEQVSSLGPAKRSAAP